MRKVFIGGFDESMVTMSLISETPLVSKTLRAFNQRSQSGNIAPTSCRRLKSFEDKEGVIFHCINELRVIFHLSSAFQYHRITIQKYRENFYKLLVDDSVRELLRAVSIEFKSKKFCK